MNYRTFLGIQEANRAEIGEVAVFGVGNENASFHPGARLAPTATRFASAGLSPLRSLEGVVDVGNCWNTAGYGDKSIQQIWMQLDQILSPGCKTLMLGGDAANTYILVRHIMRRVDDLSIVHISALDDQRVGDSSSWLTEEETLFQRLIALGLDASRSTHLGLRCPQEDPRGQNSMPSDGFAQASAEEIATSPVEVASDVVRRAQGRPTYLSFDINALDPAYAPGAVRPVCGGISSAAALSLLAAFSPLNLVGADLVGFTPLYDSSELTALAAATIGRQLLCLLVQSRGDGNETAPG